MVHIPYKGSAGVLADLIGGQIVATMDNMPPYLPQVKAGKIRALAVSPAQRSACRTRHSDGCRSRRSRLRLRRVVRFGRACSIRRRISSTSCRVKPRAFCSCRRARAPHRSGRGAGRRHAGAIRRAHQIGNREVGEGHQRGECRAAMTSAHHDSRSLKHSQFCSTLAPLCARASDSGRAGAC